MTWKGIVPIVHLVEATDQTGVKVLVDELEPAILILVKGYATPGKAAIVVTSE
jgi:hypothetical protein